MSSLYIYELMKFKCLFIAQVNRLEALVARYKVQSEELEKSEEELKADKRKLQREVSISAEASEENQPVILMLQSCISRLLIINVCVLCLVICHAHFYIDVCFITSSE